MKQEFQDYLFLDEECCFARQVLHHRWGQWSQRPRGHLRLTVAWIFASIHKDHQAEHVPTFLWHHPSSVSV